jgi:beta-fructofuranosidase
MPNQPWYGQMSLPRELSVRDGRLYQVPIRELEALRRNKVEYRDVPVSDVVSLEGINGRQIDMELVIRAADAQNLYRKFAIRFAQDESYYTSLSFRPYENVLKIDRKFSGSRRAIIHQRRSQVNSEDGSLKIRMILDRYSVEVFVNDGEQVVTATMYTDGISFWADGDVRMDVVKYKLCV